MLKEGTQSIKRSVEVKKIDGGFAIVNTVTEEFHWSAYQSILENHRLGQHQKEVAVDRFKKTLEELEDPSLAEHLKKCREEDLKKLEEEMKKNGQMLGKDTEGDNNSDQ